MELIKTNNKLQVELVENIHKNWENYISKHVIEKDVEPLLPLLNESSGLARTQDQILDALYDVTLLILESSNHLTREEKTRALYLQLNLCNCDECQKESATHINKKGQIRISKKYFENTLKHIPPAGFLEIMYTILHQILNGIFPDFDKESIINKTEKIWIDGIKELKKEKIQILGDNASI